MPDRWWNRRKRIDFYWRSKLCNSRSLLHCLRNLKRYTTKPSMQLFRECRDLVCVSRLHCGKVVLELKDKHDSLSQTHSTGLLYSLTHFLLELVPPSIDLFLFGAIVLLSVRVQEGRRSRDWDDTRFIPPPVFLSLLSVNALTAGFPVPPVTHCCASVMQ